MIPQSPEPTLYGELQLTMSISKTLLQNLLKSLECLATTKIAPEPRGTHQKNINARDLVRYVNIFQELKSQEYGGVSNFSYS